MQDLDGARQDFDEVVRLWPPLAENGFLQWFMLFLDEYHVLLSDARPLLGRESFMAFTYRHGLAQQKRDMVGCTSC